MVKKSLLEPCNNKPKKINKEIEVEIESDSENTGSDEEKLMIK